ncbi:hypothetical protein HRE53_26635 (plasmid) [Acaryochloris sp. 'Moss Beach']|uniref:DUF6399 domain-containing protein n=1 Tax=Acaryochloris sp. 'Moss Beach' TaxID=2740837 RepID=UPI001F2C5969|nr:DUF6399 domain-containing protein [Acaryochloris sp. 'Moss Beach']UJB72480.1 hypothetical protein HRE53_26635 [Acaryochloris sp. 'Moss Beach']
MMVRGGGEVNCHLSGEDNFHKGGEVYCHLTGEDNFHRGGEVTAIRPEKLPSQGVEKLLRICTARGFSEESLKVLTIIHNFDLKRADGTTAAQRLFGHPFPDVFESVVNSMGELPVARQSSKTKRLNPLTQTIFPA